MRWIILALLLNGCVSEQRASMTLFTIDIEQRNGVDMDKLKLTNKKGIE